MTTLAHHTSNDQGQHARTSHSLDALRPLVMSDADATTLNDLLRREGAPGPVQARVPIRALALGAREVHMREGASDARVFVETFGGLFHLPPITLPDDAAIVDLGSNIGTTAADFATRYPRARLLCVELDPESAELCRVNTEWFADRRRVIQGAVWVEDGRVKYGGTGFWSRRVRWVWDLAHPNAEPEIGPVQAIGIHALIDRALAELRPARGVIDYIKMDIEGSEAAVFEGDVDWLRHVDSIRVHVHPPVTIERIISRLTTGGMIPRRCWRHPFSVVAISRSALARAQRWPEPETRIAPPPAHI